MERDERNDEVLRAMANKPRWSWDDAKIVLEALDESGVSIAAFCRDAGLKYFRVLQWNQKRRQVKSTGEGQQTFLPLRVIEDTKIRRGDSREQSDWVVQIELIDCVIRVAEGASEAV
ncbi:MAG: hypothetical protein JXA30_09700 [Deltaproteobacteria bacterium]|nr:hypothetical protein [Deltaproteobacteria bacterium]